MPTTVKKERGRAAVAALIVRITGLSKGKGLKWTARGVEVIETWVRQAGRVSSGVPLDPSSGPG